MATQRRWTRCFACGAGHLSPSLGSRCPYISSEILAHIYMSDLARPPERRSCGNPVFSSTLHTGANDEACPCWGVPDHGRNSGSVYMSTRGHTIEVRVSLNTPDHLRDTDSTQQYRASPTGWLQAHQRNGTPSDVESTSIKPYQATRAQTTSGNHIKQEKNGTTQPRHDHACRHCRPDHG